MQQDNSRTVVVLGSSDPEMREIERVAAENGCRVVQAKCDGRPVRPGEAADKASIDEIYQAMLGCTADTVLMVEQPGRSIDNVLNNIGSWYLEAYGRTDNWPVEFVEIDHHSPNQKFPDDWPLWRRSSLGQLMGALRLAATPRQRWIGALDHDLPGALREARADDVLDEVLDIYCEGAAHLFGGVPPDVYKRQAYSTYEAIKELGLVPFRYAEYGEMVVPVYRLKPDPSTAGATGEHYPLPALPLALALAGKAGLSIIRRRDGLLAWRLQGSATPAQVRYFLNEFKGVMRGLPEPNAPYGFPDRGLAGGLVGPDWRDTVPA